MFNKYSYKKEKKNKSLFKIIIQTDCICEFINTASSDLKSTENVHIFNEITTNCIRYYIYI